MFCGTQNILNHDQWSLTHRTFLITIHGLWHTEHSSSHPWSVAQNIPNHHPWSVAHRTFFVTSMICGTQNILNHIHGLWHTEHSSSHPCSVAHRKSQSPSMVFSTQNILRHIHDLWHTEHSSSHPGFVAHRIFVITTSLTVLICSLQNFKSTVPQSILKKCLLISKKKPSIFLNHF